MHCISSHSSNHSGTDTFRINSDLVPILKQKHTKKKTVVDHAKCVEFNPIPTYQLPIAPPITHLSSG
jgi:hypothetical protein